MDQKGNIIDIREWRNDPLKRVVTIRYRQEKFYKMKYFLKWYSQAKVMKVIDKLMPIIEELKEQIVQNNCILIQFDNNIDNLFMLKLIYIIIFRITGLSFDNIFNYLKNNFFELGNDSFIKAKKEEILSFLV